MGRAGFRSLKSSCPTHVAGRGSCVWRDGDTPMGDGRGKVELTEASRVNIEESKAQNFNAGSRFSNYVKGEDDDELDERKTSAPAKLKKQRTTSRC